MSTKSSTATVMAWNWVIQSLSIFKQVDPSTLTGVINKSPLISDDLGKDSREIVSLRVLESLFLHENEATIDTLSTQNPKISFDPSEQCEDVLQRILKESSEPMTELEKQKWNVRPFIMHKRDSLPKSPLQKLKEELLEGSHPILASLKEKTNLGVSKVSENMCPDLNVIFKDQATISKDDLVSVNLDDETNILPKSPLHNPNSTSGKNEQIKRKENEIPKDPLVKDLDENMLMDHIEQTPSKNLEQSHENVNIDHGQHKLTSRHPCGKKDSKRVSTDNITDPKNDTIPNVSTSVPSDNEMKETENSDSEKSDDEIIDIAAKKEAFLNSQYTLSQDSMATIDYSTETSLCMKCNKGGELLVCSSDTCQLKVHETCLSSTTTLDENGKFFCPFCAYSHAISDYLEAKKRASLARKDLQAFVSSGVKHRPNVPSKKGADLDKKKSTQMAEKVKVNGNRDTVSKNNEDCMPHKHVDIRLNKGKRKCIETENQVSSHSRRCRERKPQYTSPRIPLIRRKILLWTKSEVEILKEGMQKFSSDDNNKNIPWKDILDFGRDVFHKSRTTIDLKDKWRNICKGSPDTKKQKL